MTSAPTEADPQVARPAFLGPNLAPDESAPNGYTIDPITGDRRPKKKAGRPRTRTAPVPEGGLTAPPGPPSIEDLRARAPRTAAEPDRPPGAQRDGRGKVRTPKPAAEVPPFRAGPIAKGVNRLYAKTGRLVRIGDRDIGDSIIACTRKALIVNAEGARVPDPDDITVGEAWEELARTNPRIRAFLLRLISGGAWTQLFMAHAPIFLAVLMKDGIRQRVPFHRLLDAFLDDGDGAQDDGGDWDEQEGPEPGAGGFTSMLAGLTSDDMGQMAGMFEGMMSQMAGRMPPQPSRAPVVDDFVPPEEPPP